MAPGRCHRRDDLFQDDPRARLILGCRPGLPEARSSLACPGLSGLAYIKKTPGMTVEFQNITKQFNNDSEEEVRALDALNLSIPSRQFLVVIGANGSGKSTLLNILSGS